MDGHKMPRTTVPRLNAAYVLLHNRAGDCGESGGFLLLSLVLNIAADICKCFHMGRRTETSLTKWKSHHRTNEYAICVKIF